MKTAKETDSTIESIEPKTLKICPPYHTKDVVFTFYEKYPNIQNRVYRYKTAFSKKEHRAMIISGSIHNSKLYAEWFYVPPYTDLSNKYTNKVFSIQEQFIHEAVGEVE